MSIESTTRLVGPFVMAAYDHLRKAGASHREATRIIRACVQLAAERGANGR